MSNRTAHQGIVVGVDGSPSSDMAVRWAAREAGMRNVALSLVHVVERSPRKIQGEEIISVAVELAKNSAQNGVVPQLQVEVYFGATGPAFFDLSTQAQLIVVGCRGHGTVGRVLLGSVSTGLIHHAHCPVAVIHDEIPVTSQPSQLPVVVGIDGSPASELATAIGFDEASDPASGELVSLQMIPLRVRRMRLERASRADAEWLRTTLQHTSRKFGIQVAARPNDLLEVVSVRSDKHPRMTSDNAR